jgi:hypothetical protein
MVCGFGKPASEKKRITTIMVQCVKHWFSKDRDPMGEIWPTVGIFFGASACLEDIDSEGAAVRRSLIRKIFFTTVAHEQLENTFPKLLQLSGVFLKTLSNCLRCAV